MICEILPQIARHLAYAVGANTFGRSQSTEKMLLLTDIIVYTHQKS